MGLFGFRKLGCMGLFGFRKLGCMGLCGFRKLGCMGLCGGILLFEHRRKYAQNSLGPPRLAQTTMSSGSRKSSGSHRRSGSRRRRSSTSHWRRNKKRSRIFAVAVFGQFGSWRGRHRIDSCGWLLVLAAVTIKTIRQENFLPSTTRSNVICE
jgi:hypothetical protein